MKLLGIDYGEKRVGIAISDEEGNMAFPKDVIVNDAKLVDSILDLITSEKVEVIVIGESKNFDIEENPIMKKINVFKELLEEKVSIPIHFEPEFFSTQEARRGHVRRAQVSRQAGGQGSIKNVDAKAATIILQSFIDKQE